MTNCHPVGFTNLLVRWSASECETIELFGSREYGLIALSRVALALRGIVVRGMLAAAVVALDPQRITLSIASLDPLLGAFAEECLISRKVDQR